MKKPLLFVLTLSGLSALSANIFRKYHFEKDAKTWPDAKKYCRMKFNDLAAVNNQGDNDRLLSLSQNYGNYAWIGLWDHFQGWRWALGNADLNNDFIPWNLKTNEPDNTNPNESCTVIGKSGLWYDSKCENSRPAVCYHEPGPARYILVKKLMTWHEARTYCRSNYTDLVSVRNASENGSIATLVKAKTWIGLHRKTWSHWTDKSPRTFTNWNDNQPEHDTKKSCAMMSTTTGKWSDHHCEKKQRFFCQSLVSPQRKTRFKLKFQSDADLNDPAVAQQVLEQLHAKLETLGLPDFKLRWTQTDGQTFHKEQKRKKEEGSGC